MPSSPLTIVFLHGFSESQEIWTDFIRAFSPAYQLLTPDLLGHGANVVVSQDYSMEAQAEYVVGYLREQGVEKALIVGHSMGGYVALALAEHYPELVAGLVLFHSTALPDTDEKKANRNKNIEFVRRHGVEKFMATFIRPLFAPANREKMPKQQALLEAIGKATPEATVLGGLQAMRDRPDRTPVVRDATFPVLFIGGKDDTAVSTESLLPQLSLPAESHVLLLSNVGHLGYLEAPEQTSRVIADFARRILEA